MTATQLTVNSSKPSNTPSMKLVFCWLLLGLPLIVFGQSVDTVTVTGKVDSLLKISNTLLGKGDFTNAQVAIDHAAQLASETLGEASLQYGSCCNLYGLLSFSKGNYPDAEQWFLKVQSIRKIGLGTDHPDYIGMLVNLAVVNQKMGQYDKAISLFLEAKETFEANQQHLNHPFYLNCLANLADLYSLLGENEKSEPLHLKVLDLREKKSGRNIPAMPKA